MRNSTIIFKYLFIALPCTHLLQYFKFHNKRARLNKQIESLMGSSIFS